MQLSDNRQAYCSNVSQLFILKTRMSNLTSPSPHSHSLNPAKQKTQTTLPCLLTTLFTIAMIVAVLYCPGELSLRTTTSDLAANSCMLQRSEVMADGEVKGPEDLAYDKRRRLIYTGCEDGWIKRITVNESVADSVVTNWVNTGGRPLGLALEKTGELIVADAFLGLLRVTSKEGKETKIEKLADEHEGLKFNLTDGVDVGEDGTIYFTDATYKYNLKEFYHDFLDNEGHGRFMSYNPATKKVTLIARNLYFPNGVAVAPDQKFVIYCETTMNRCRKYYLEGPKKGRRGEFSPDLPGMPDNIHYVGQGQYFIGMATSVTPEWDFLGRHPLTRKVAAMVTKYIGILSKSSEKNGGIVVVDLEGKLRAHYSDPQLSLISSGIKIDNYIYCGSLSYPFILRLNVNQSN